MIWVNVAGSGIEPPKERNVLCFCPEWNESGYQVAKWSGTQFYYESQPNELFDGYVTDWAIFMEAD